MQNVRLEDAIFVLNRIEENFFFIKFIEIFMCTISFGPFFFLYVL